MIVEKFEQTVKMYENNIAVKAKQKMLTYGKLNRLANWSARTILQKYDTSDLQQNEHTIGLFFNHGIHAVVSLLGVLKARKIYIPLDSTYPRKRLGYMLNHFGIRMIITDNRGEEPAKRLTTEFKEDVTIINIEKISPGLSPDNLDLSTEEDTLAYILHTSGSSGRPKGVVQSCKNVLFFCENYIRELSITYKDHFTFLSSFSHDGAVEDIFPALLSGAALYPLDIRESNVPKIAQWLQKEEITVYHSVPSLFRYFAGTLAGHETFRSVRVICMGAEPLYEQDVYTVHHFFPGASLAHMYGQTESSINTMGFIDTTSKVPKIKIGKPLEGIDVLVLNNDGEEVDEFDIGEIFIASDYLSPGYWQDPQANDRVFLYDTTLGRLYKTGDLGKVDFDGSIEFMGRTDSQVKVRGFRIETGEIENQLLRLDHIKEAVVITRQDDEGRNYLEAYILSAKEYTVSELRDYLSLELPDYMLPLVFIQLERMPVTANGKIDKKSLPQLQGIRLGLNSTYVVPGTDIEKKIADIWKAVLRIDKVGLDDNFFDLGGNSLDILTINMKLKSGFRKDIPHVAMFRYPTVGALAGYLKEEETVKDSGNKETGRSAEIKKARDRYQQRIKKRNEVKGV